MNRFIALGFIMSVLAVAACSIESADTAENVTITTTTPMNATNPIPIVARMESKFTITLPSNQTTGYQWQMSGKPDKSVVVFVGSTYNSPENAVPGKGGSESWTFKTTGKGVTKITLEYARPWEKNTKPVKTQVFSVSVS